MEEKREEKSRYRDVNFLLLYSSNGLVRGKFTHMFVSHQSIKITCRIRRPFLSWSLTADCWPVKVSYWGLILGVYVTGNGAT